MKRWRRLRLRRRRWAHRAPRTVTAYAETAAFFDALVAFVFIVVVAAVVAFSAVTLHPTDNQPATASVQRWGIEPDA